MESRARSAIQRWALLATLALAVIGMHSLVTLGPAAASHDLSTMVGASAGPASHVSEPAASMAGSACCLDQDHGSSDHSPGHGHDALHLCLAVLAALAGLVIGWLLWQSGLATMRHRAPNIAVVGAVRGPPRARAATDLLSSLCVLRL